MQGRKYGVQPAWMPTWVPAQAAGRWAAVRVLAAWLLAGSLIMGVAAAPSHAAAAPLPAPGNGVLVWGNNSYWQSTAPADLAPGSGAAVLAVAGGGHHSLALRTDGTVAAWGRSLEGQIDVPPGLAGVTALAAGDFHSLALQADGTVAAWGSSRYGQATVPMGLRDVVAIAAGGLHSLALQADGTVVAWGDDRYGQAHAPLDSATTGRTITAVAAGGYHNLALLSDGTVIAWGDNRFGQSTVPEGLAGVMALAAGSLHSLALKADGTVVAWGENNFGQASPPEGLEGVVAIAAGVYHNLALKQDGTVVAWGRNLEGQTTLPARLADVAALDAGGFHSLAVAHIAPEPPACEGEDARVTLVLEAQPHTARNFRVWGIGEDGSFYLDDPAADDGDAYLQMRSFAVLPGQHNFSLQAPFRWWPEGATCTAEGGAGGAIGVATSRATGLATNDTRGSSSPAPCTYDPSLRSVGVTVAACDDVTVTFHAVRKGRLVARTYADANGDGVRQATEAPASAEWIELWETATGSPPRLLGSNFTDATGEWRMLDLIPNRAYTVCLQPQAGQTNTQPGPGSEDSRGWACYGFTLQPGQTVGAWFGSAPEGAGPLATAAPTAASNAMDSEPTAGEDTAYLFLPSLISK
jgi:hypothetical protein